MQIRRFEPSDAREVTDMILESVRVCNGPDYDPEVLGQYIRGVKPDAILERASWTHFYVLCEEGRIIGSGAIGPAETGEEGVNCLYSLFLLPEYQRRGLGRVILDTLERDSFFAESWKTIVQSSITAVPFYEKMGYVHRDGVPTLIDDDYYPMEKLHASEGSPV